jgi:hypothetical protein
VGIRFKFAREQDRFGCCRHLVVPSRLSGGGFELTRERDQFDWLQARRLLISTVLLMDGGCF